LNDGLREESQKTSGSKIMYWRLQCELTIKVKNESSAVSRQAAAIYDIAIYIRRL